MKILLFGFSGFEDAGDILDSVKPDEVWSVNNFWEHGLATADRCYQIHPSTSWVYRAAEHAGEVIARFDDAKHHIRRPHTQIFDTFPPAFFVNGLSYALAEACISETVDHLVLRGVQMLDDEHRHMYAPFRLSLELAKPYFGVIDHEMDTYRDPRYPYAIGFKRFAHQRLTGTL